MEQIKFTDVTLAFGNNVIVDSFDLTIQKGEIVTLFGPSGCGKSSIMKMVLGINTPVAGSVTIDNVEASNHTIPISYVPQDNELLPWLSVKENIEMWAKHAGQKGMDAIEILDIVDLTQHADKLPAVLSGGMARRTALARGLATRSDILCFDEAMVGIEKTMRQKLLLKIRSYIKQTNATAIFISHDYEETIYLSDRILVFTPPPTLISVQIDVAQLTSNTERNEKFVESELFKNIYNQMLTT
jgi:NitT/TauT family transport system ATP-binding protein